MICSSCNREGEHCPGCGSVSKHPLIQKTASAAGILKIDVRYYRCRKCGVEYGWLKAKFYEVECCAPPIAKIIPVKDDLQKFVERINEAIYFIRSYGGTIEFKKGILEEPIDPDAQENSEKLGNNGKDVKQTSEQSTQSDSTGTERDIRDIPEGFTLNEEGQLVPPISSDDLFEGMKKRSEQRDNDDSNKN
jgi:hypothetical protein